MSDLPTSQKTADAYWRRNLRLLAVLLTVWFTVACVLSVFLVEPLNKFQFLGVPFGMWIAQQGSTVAFIALIFVYCRAMGKLDREFGVKEDGR